MARVTVEDCVEIVANRFELVQLASQRARDISSGARLTINRDNDKDSVVALREIAEKTISAEALREAVIRNFQKALNTDVLDEQTSNPTTEQIEEEIRGYQVVTPEANIIEPEGEFADENIDAND